MHSDQRKTKHDSGKLGDDDDSNNNNNNNDNENNGI